MRSKSRGSKKGLALSLIILPIVALVLLAPIISQTGLDKQLGDIFPFIFITTCLLLPFVGALMMVLDLRHEEKERQALKTSGAPAEAVIKAIKMGQSKITAGVEERWEAVLTLEVQPSEGKPFTAEARHFVSVFEIPQFQPGLTIQVRYDPDDPSRVVVA